MNATPSEPRTLGQLLETQNKAAIARKLGVDSKTVWRWAHGEAIPAGDKLQALARLLGIDAQAIDLAGAR